MQFLFLLVNFSLISSNELHIGGIFPIAGKGGWQGGQACMPAAKLALEDVNKETNLLPGFKLILHSNDSEVSFWLIVIAWIFMWGVLISVPDFNMAAICKATDCLMKFFLFIILFFIWRFNVINFICFFVWIYRGFIIEQWSEYDGIYNLKLLICNFVVEIFNPCESLVFIFSWWKIMLLRNSLYIYSTLIIFE